MTEDQQPDRLTTGPADGQPAERRDADRAAALGDAEMPAAGRRPADRPTRAEQPAAMTDPPLDPYAPLSADGATVRLGAAMVPRETGDSGADAVPEAADRAGEAVASDDEPTVVSSRGEPGEAAPEGAGTARQSPGDATAGAEPGLPAAGPRSPDSDATTRLQPPFFAPGTTRTPRVSPVPDGTESRPDPAGESPARPGQEELDRWADVSTAEPARWWDVPVPSVGRPDSGSVPDEGTERGAAGAPGSGAPVPSPEGVTTADPDAPAVRAPRWRFTPAGALIWLLLALLGFTLVVQLQSNDDDAGLASARQEDLVGILSDLEARDQRLQQEISALEQSQRQLSSGVAGRQAALAEAGKRAEELGLLSGTLPARGPGLRISIAARSQPIKASAILNAVQELRGSGGEVMEIIGDNGVAVRIVASSYFVDADGGRVMIDGKQLSGPYTLWVIGVPSTMQTALQIPGGVVASVSQAGGNVTMEQRGTVEVTAVRQPTSLQYARPVS